MEEHVQIALNHCLQYRRRWVVWHWDYYPGEDGIIRFKNPEDESNPIRSAQVVHIWTERRSDETFGIFPRFLEAIVNKKLDALFVVFNRKGSRIYIVYYISRKYMEKAASTWAEGKDGQFQIPIEQFVKFDEFEL